MHNPDEFYRFNTVDADKKIGAVLREGHFFFQVLQESSPYEVKTDVVSSTLMYVGYATVGLGTDESGWQIFRMQETSSGSLTKTYANRTSDFDKVWDDRATYTFD